MYIWSMYKVNYVFIFDFDGRDHFRYQNMLEVTRRYCNTIKE
jgi:hypothetical protein